MADHPFCFAGRDFVARPSGALYWPAEGMLILSDLHLGKSQRMARRGGTLLPPFETRETLDRLAAEIQAIRPALLALLGDIFDDDAAGQALPAPERAQFDSLLSTQQSFLVAGNHDGGSGAPLLRHSGLQLRHIAAPGQGPDISGHYHPKARIAGRSRAAFLVGRDHLILPAFGHYTGGLRHDHPSLQALVPNGIAILTGQRALAIPLRYTG
ncbi:ligase-associated DNA damage response endonuclease PdeM [Paracoccus xiamenensis]|uniref:ligase-associated DNA damage response endonuclease PdeM n=1 Tax=Paracoccus xiamenensis TaxID=2714901 RepID=UPI00140E089D|nr:ligase-associated DNA damage response endonuclease PdeM [Paracoccus xiamenensis]NHF74776.1 ligase-associated DNA damage response endonuclease PdeM [Paracoccus xiamenensis]